MTMFDEFQTYDVDLPLLRELGLNPFKGKTRDNIEVGTVEGHDGSWCKIMVCGLPAQFWDFEVHCSEGDGKTTKFSTGSGCLSDYWPFAKAIMDGMIVIKD